MGLPSPTRGTAACCTNWAYVWRHVFLGKARLFTHCKESTVYLAAMPRVHLQCASGERQNLSNTTGYFESLQFITLDLPKVMGPGIYSYTSRKTSHETVLGGSMRDYISTGAKHLCPGAPLYAQPHHISPQFLYRRGHGKNSMLPVKSQLLI